MGTGSFWLWTIFFAFTGYLFVRIFCLFFLNPIRSEPYLPSQQSDRENSDETINIDYADYASIVSTTYETIN